MSVCITHFESLRQRFPTFEELRVHLESLEGGSLRYITGPDSCGILRYTTDKTSATDIFRSVIWDLSANRPLCVAPPRSTEGLPPLNVQLSAIEDFVDGCMMNVWVGLDGVLHMATRTRIGGDNTFYGTKTFKEMFEECLASTTLKTVSMLEKELNALRVEQGVSSVFVSFVLQHPAHRVVAKIVTPTLYIVHVGTVSETAVVNIAEKAVNWPQSLARLQVSSYPAKTFQTEKDVQDLLQRTAAQRGWRWQGLVFKDGMGNRWRMRTPTYTMMRELRGSEANDMDRFFRLRDHKKVLDYLTHYGEDRNMFWGYEQILRKRTSDILSAYVDVHKAHKVAFKDLPAALKPAVYMLHMKWRNELREKGFKVRLQNAIDVVNNMRDFEKRRLLDAPAYVQVAVDSSD